MDIDYMVYDEIYKCNKLTYNKFKWHNFVRVIK